jgi:hypothetical protein
MKLLPTSHFYQVYSRSIVDQPEHVWVIDLESEGVNGEVIDRCIESSAGWTGWGFLVIKSEQDYTTACLLFEHREDAVMTKLVYGERLYAN